MILQCGETHAAWLDRLSTWHRWYFLWPRKVGEKDGRDVCAWLCWGERRGNRERRPCFKAGGALVSSWRWEYRA